MAGERRRPPALALCLAGAIVAVLATMPEARADDGGVYIGAQLHGAYESSTGDGDVSGGVTAGYRFNEYFGFEASYKKTHLDSILSTEDDSIHGAELALRGTVPLTDWLGLTAKAGAYRWRTSDGPAGSADHGTDAVVGAGFLFRLSDRVSLSTEYERILGFDVNRSDDRTSIGVRFDFN